MKDTRDDDYSGWYGKVAQSRVLWIGIAVIGILVALSIFFIFREQPKEKKKNKGETTGLVLPKLGKVGKYSLNYAKKFGSDFTLNLGSFERDEIWKGNGTYDNQTFFEGESSILVVSANRSPGKVYLEEKLNLKNYTSFDILVYVEEPKNIESLDIKFGNTALTNYYQFKISNLIKGWNFERMPRNQFVATTGEALQPFDWSQIEKIELTLISRPNTKAMVSLDALRAERDTDYLSEWETIDESFLGVGKGEETGKTALLARNFGATTATLKKLADVEDFTFQASISPQKAGQSGIFFRGNPENSYGYYFLIGGLGVNTWQLAKTNIKGFKVLKEGQVGNITFESDEKYWLRVIAKGGSIKAYLSRDGQSFSKVASVTDSEFSFGQIGISAQGGTFSFFDDFSFKRSTVEGK